MKRTTKTTKLELDREPIRPLTSIPSDDLAQINGGSRFPTISYSCTCITR